MRQDGDVAVFERPRLRRAHVEDAGRRPARLTERHTHGRTDTEAPRRLTIDARIENLNGAPTLQYDQTDFGGVYEVSSTDPPLSVKFAAQPAPFESSLDELSPAQVTILKSVANVIPWSPNLSLKGLVEHERTGLEFWLPIVIAALLVACVETFLGQWFSRAK